MEASGKAKTNWGWLKIFLVVIMKPLFFPFSRFQLIKALFLSSRHGNFRTFSIIFPRINSKGKIPIFLHGEKNWSVALRYFLLPSWSLWPPYKLSTFKFVFNKGTHFWCIYWNFAYVPFPFFWFCGVVTTILSGVISWISDAHSGSPGKLDSGKLSQLDRTVNPCSF